MKTSKKVKTILYTIIMRPVLMYGHEVWTLNTKAKSKIQAIEMKVLRLIAGVTRMDRVRNEDVRAGLGVESVLDLVEKDS